MKASGVVDLEAAVKPEQFKKEACRRRNENMEREEEAWTVSEAAG